jgi:hypothetical protein
MHYKNGREAKPGDIVINLPTGKTGVISRLETVSTTCNARLTAVSDIDSYVTLRECLHIDDVRAADTPDTSAGS